MLRVVCKAHRWHFFIFVVSFIYLCRSFLYLSHSQRWSSVRLPLDTLFIFFLISLGFFIFSKDVFYICLIHSEGHLQASPFTLFLKHPASSTQNQNQHISHKINCKAPNLICVSHKNWKSVEKITAAHFFKVPNISNRSDVKNQYRECKERK